MAASKRLKDGVLEYADLRAQCVKQQDVILKAQADFQTLKSALEVKIRDVMTELVSCCPPTEGEGGTVSNRLVEVGGKIYLLTVGPKDLHLAFPSYVVEVQIER